MLKEKRMYRTLVLSIVAGALSLATMGYTVAKYSTSIPLLSNSSHGRVAGFSVSIDGVEDGVVQFDCLATTKLSDIERSVVGGVAYYNGHSFVDGAYCKHTVSIRNDSEVVVDCKLEVGVQNHDDRVFYALVPTVHGTGVQEDDILSYLYMGDSGTELSDERDYLSALNERKISLGYGEHKDFTLLVWSEHDAVFTDADGDGIADENGKQLSELELGVPSEELSIRYIAMQKD